MSFILTTDIGYMTQKKEKEKLKDAALLALKMKEETMNHGCKEPSSRNSKRQGNQFSHRALEQLWLCWHLDFSATDFGLLTSRTVRE